METVTLLKLTEHWTTERATGNTTRQVDCAIQLLFQGKEIEVKDHWQWGVDIRANKYLLNKIKDRLFREHGLGLKDWKEESKDGIFYLKLNKK